MFWCVSQLEAKCFSQQEQLDSLQEQLDTEREQAETRRVELEKELALRVDQVRGGEQSLTVCDSGVAPPQVTTMYEDVQKEKEALVGKMAAVEIEVKSLREQLVSSEESCSAATKVCVM